MTLPPSDAKQLTTDLEWINGLASVLSIGGRGETLQALTSRLINEYIECTKPTLTNEQKEEAVFAELDERVHLCRSNAFAHDLLSMAANNDVNFDDAVFPDGRAHVILIADSEIPAVAEGVLMSYLEYLDNYPEYDVIHPSDFSGPKKDDEDEEWQRLVDDFSSMLREWRDDFIRKLIEDCGKKAHADST